MKARPSAASRLAIVTAVGRPRATSAAKLGPDSTATGAAGATSAAISDIVLQRPRLDPLGAEQQRQCRAATRAELRGRRAGIAPAPTISAASAPAIARRMSVVAVIAGSSAMPGRIDRVLVALVDRRDDRRVARPQHRDSAAGAPGDERQRGAPGAAADDREPLIAGRSSARVRRRVERPARPAPARRARRSRPSRSRSSPAQAIIAPLSVHSAGGGATKARPARRPAPPGARAAAHSRRPRRRQPGSCPRDDARGTRRPRCAVRSTRLSQIASSTAAARSATICGRRRAASSRRDASRTAVLSPENEKSQPPRPCSGRGRAKRRGSPSLRRALDRRPAGIARGRAAWRLLSKASPAASSSVVPSWR